MANRHLARSVVLQTLFEWDTVLAPDAKAEEIEDIFSDGPNVDITKLVNALSKIAPMHASKWRNIDF